MGRQTIKVFFKLIRTALYKELLSEDEKKLLSQERFAELVRLSYKHDIGHLLALGLMRNAIPLEQSIEKSILNASYRYGLLNADYHSLCKKLEDSKIPFLPLKGAVLREIYPEPWLRTSCDIDVLVREDDVDQVADLLVKECGYFRGDKSSHDIAMDTPKKVHLELHYDLVEEGRAKKSSKVLEKVWESSIKREGYQYWNEMTDELFYFYHVAHMAKHFSNGGCGIRPFIDLYLLEKREGIDWAKREELLEQGELLEFSRAVRKLCRVWFENEEPDAISYKMENYILSNGLYGTVASQYAVRAKTLGGQRKVLMQMIFVPYDSLKEHYPILIKHRWLLPIMEVRRWCKLVFCGHMKRVFRTLRIFSGVSKDEVREVKDVLEEFGL